VLIRATLSIAAVYIQRILNVKAEWRVGADGSITVKLDCERHHELHSDPFPFLPRFGLRFFLPRELDALEYLGYGPTESYIDKHQACWYGKFASSVAAQHEDYLKPQENGSHWACDRLLLSNRWGRGLSAERVGSPFCFNVSPYTQEELTRKPHNFELEPCGETVLCLDYAQSGVGSNSCGPELLEKYRFDEERFSFSVALRPR
jgi:beta-galactosidase